MVGLMSVELKRVWKEIAMVCMRQLSERTEGNQRNEKEKNSNVKVGGMYRYFMLYKGQEKSVSCNKHWKTTHGKLLLRG
jgi:hypothetical protein